MFKKLWGKVPKIGDTADLTLLNNGMETPTIILAGLIATKITTHSLDRSKSSPPDLFDFNLENGSKSPRAAKLIRVIFSRGEFHRLEILSSSNEDISPRKAGGRGKGKIRLYVTLEAINTFPHCDEG